MSDLTREEIEQLSAKALLTVRCRRCDWYHRDSWRICHMAMSIHMERNHGVRYLEPAPPGIGACVFCGDATVNGVTCWAHSDVVLV